MANYWKYLAAVSGTSPVVVAALLLSSSMGNCSAQEMSPEVSPHSYIDPGHTMEWEAKEVPPPEGEWISKMPGGVAPRETRALPAYPVRVFYLVPSNRVPMPGAVTRIQQYMIQLQDFYRDQMDCYGFGPKTISIETESDNVTPKVHVIYGSNTDDYYRASPWSRVASAAQTAGLPVWSSGQVWLGVFEAHVMNADGSITGEYNGGANLGSGADAGLGITNSNSLALARPDYITNSSPYHGMVLPELGPYSMVNGVTAASFDGTQLGELSSVRFGVLFHELSHGLGLPHDFRNDMNFRGNLMGNGFRGFRSRMMINTFPANETRLGYGPALMLNSSRYFNTGPFLENTRPTVAAISSSSLTLKDGHVPISFTASDASGLSLATLEWNSSLIAELPLTGNNVTTEILTSSLNKAASNVYTLSVFDIYGNKTESNVTMALTNQNQNAAPVPFFHLEKSTVNVGETVRGTVYLTSDDSTPFTSCKVEWDWNGDGHFDTAPVNASLNWFTTTYASGGCRLIRCRITDSAGAYSISTPIAIRVLDSTSGINGWELY